METNTEIEYIGMMLLGELSYKKGKLLEKEDDDFEDEIIKLYKESGMISNHNAADLAIYYELKHYPFDIVEKEYLNAVSKSTSSYVLFNLADFYKKYKKYPEMIKYHIKNINENEDFESMLYLAFHYSDINNVEAAIMYYNMALFNYKPQCNDDYIITFIKSTELIKLSDIIDENNLCKDNDIYRKIKNVYNKRKYITIYNNKLRLFTQLNHITECGICLNTELNINLYCSHCVCKKCYLEIFDSPCPFCRM